METVDELQADRLLVFGSQAADGHEDGADHLAVGGCTAGGAGVGRHHVEEAEGVALVEGAGDTTPAAAALGGTRAADGIEEAVICNGDDPPFEREEPGGPKVADRTEDGEEGLLKDVFWGDDAGECGRNLAVETAERLGICLIGFLREGSFNAYTQFDVVQR
jgi:hypothetical protein